MSQETFTFFWKGPFSQWYACTFEIEGLLYNCTEQYMMAEKARCFGDEQILAQIMDATSPRVQKRLGRQVRGFEKHIWEREDPNNKKPFCWNVVWRGNMAKFSQNEHLLKRLLKTQGTTLVEASPVDRIWGIGLAEDNLAALSRETWQGRNWLGEVLTDVCEQLFRAAKDPPL